MPGPQELLVIAFVALLVLGPERLPEAARRLAVFIGRVRAATRDTVDELRQAAEVDGLVRDLHLEDVGRELGELRRSARGAVDEVLHERSVAPAPAVDVAPTGEGRVRARTAPTGEATAATDAAPAATDACGDRTCGCGAHAERASAVALRDAVTPHSPHA